VKNTAKTGRQPGLVTLSRNSGDAFVQSGLAAKTIASCALSICGRQVELAAHDNNSNHGRREPILVAVHRRRQTAEMMMGFRREYGDSNSQPEHCV